MGHQAHGGEVPGHRRGVQLGPVAREGAQELVDGALQEPGGAGFLDGHELLDALRVQEAAVRVRGGPAVLGLPSGRDPPEPEAPPSQ